jgi:hypothetical protein
MCTKLNLRTLKVTDLRILDLDKRIILKLDVGEMGCDE